MVAELIQKYFTPKKIAANDWAPQKRTFFCNEELADEVYAKGYAVAGKIAGADADKLNALYATLHDFQKPAGGMFYSLYSKDLDYRKKVHNGIGEIIKPVYDSLFHDYKSVLNSFIVKVSGPQSEFSLHQDSTGLDETKYSNLSVWIPLQDTDMANGCMCVVPYSHKMFSPYRGISFRPPFDSISGTVRRYLQPVELKKGEILLFDNRLVHNSVINSSGRNRVVVMSGIYPTPAPIISCYKDETAAHSLIEIIEQADDFLLTYPNFMDGCACRPETGRSVGFVKWDTGQISEARFIALCKKYNVPQTNIAALVHPSANQAILAEPIAQ
jgi:hypothetical protein